MDYVFQFGLVFQHLDTLLAGLQITIIVGVSAGLLGLIIGWILALQRLSGNRAVRFASGAYVEFWRNTPLIIQLFFVYFGITALTGFSFSAIEAGLITIVLNTTAYYAEILRGGVKSIPQEQFDAARSIGLTYLKILRLIVVPWTMKTVFPSLVNQFILTILGTSVLSIIAVPDLMHEAKGLQAITGRTIEFYLVTAVIYIMAILSISVVLRFIESRFFTMPEVRLANKKSKVVWATFRIFSQ